MAGNSRDRSRRPVRVAIPSWGVRAAESFHARGFRMVEESHDFHELYYVLRGALKYHDRDRHDPVYLSEGCFHPVPGGSIHRLEDQADATLIILALGSSFVDADPVRSPLWRRLVDRHSPAVRPDDFIRRRIEHSLRTILAEQAAERFGFQAVVTSEATSVLIALARLPEECGESNSHTRVAAVIRDLEASFYEDWTVDEAARRAHLSRRRFCTIFRELTGMSLVDYRNELRLDHAATLMRERGHTIAGAAFSSGFQDLTHFYRLFRRRYSMPPGEWIKAPQDL